MAAGKLPEPGSEYGPCTDPCEHLDCAETRRMAETVCELCGKPIGYGARLYDRTTPAQRADNRPKHPSERTWALVHADCVEK